MHIILYILDALRADHLSCYGYQRETSPHVDALAREGVLFENCCTSTTWARPVAASILAGVYLDVHLTRSRSERFATSLTRLPQLLRRADFRAVAFSTMPNIASEIAFSEGFDQYRGPFRDPGVLAKRRAHKVVNKDLLKLLPDRVVARPYAEDMNDHLVPWLSENRDDNTFSLIWSTETHGPYGAPDGFRRYSTASPDRLSPYEIGHGRPVPRGTGTLATQERRAPAAGW